MVKSGTRVISNIEIRAPTRTKARKRQRSPIVKPTRPDKPSHSQVWGEASVGSGTSSSGPCKGAEEKDRHHQADQVDRQRADAAPGVLEGDGADGPATGGRQRGQLTGVRKGWLHGRMILACIGHESSPVGHDALWAVLWCGRPGCTRGRDARATSLVLWCGLPGCTRRRGAYSTSVVLWCSRPGCTRRRDACATSLVL